MTKKFMTAALTFAALTLLAGPAMAQTAPKPNDEQATAPKPDDSRTAPQPNGEQVIPAEEVVHVPAPGTVRSPESDPLRFWIGVGILAYGDGDQRPDRADDKIIAAGTVELELWISLSQHVGLSLRGHVGGGILGGEGAMFFGGAAGVMHRALMDTFRIGAFVGGSSARNSGSKTTTSELNVFGELGWRFGNTLNSVLMSISGGYKGVFNEIGNQYSTGEVKLNFKFQLDFMPF